MSDARTTADLVGRPEALSRQVELLAHDDAAVRYWAGVGLYGAVRMHAGGEPGWHDRTAMDADVLRRHLEDPDAGVRIEVAAALLGLEPDAASHAGSAPARAAAVLGAAIQSDELLLAHQALEKVLYLPVAAPHFKEYVAAASGRVAALEMTPGSPVYPIRQAIDMYRYLYEGDALFYEDDLPYLNLGR